MKLARRALVKLVQVYRLQRRSWASWLDKCLVNVWRSSLVNVLVIKHVWLILQAFIKLLLQVFIKHSWAIHELSSSQLDVCSMSVPRAGASLVV